MKKCFDVIWVILILLGTVNTAFAEEKSILYNTSVTVVRTAHGNVWFVAKNGRGEKYNFWTTQTEKSNNMVFEAFTLQNNPNKFDIYYYKNRKGYLNGITYAYAYMFGFAGRKYDLESGKSTR